MYNGIIILNTIGIVQFINRSAELTLGLRDSAVKGKHYREVFKDKEILTFFQKIYSVLAKGRKVANHKIKVKHTVLVVSGTMLLKNDKPDGVVVIFQDVSDFEFVAEELRVVRQLNMELDAIINNSYDGIWVIDGNGVILKVNKTYEAFSGIKIEEVIGRNIRDLVKEGYFSDSAALHVLRERKPCTVIHDIKTGKRAMVTAVPIFDENNDIWRIVSNVRDITEMIQLKEKLEQMELESKRYRHELEQLKQHQINNGKIIFKSPKMVKVLETVKRVAKVDSTVLILGDSGVGKGVLAEWIHQWSDRKEGPFIKINCGAIPESILESELFGYEKGAFTGALKEGKEGLIDLADQGTLFLDEIAELPLHLQSKLLQVIQEQQFYRVGGRKTVKVNTRIIAATNKNLEEMVKHKLFREDLFYRLNVVPVKIPPLRERKEDIPLLIFHFLKNYNEKYGYTKSMTADVIDYLIQYDWPGNVRELENLIERLVVTSDKDRITIYDLPREFIQNNISFGHGRLMEWTELVEGMSYKKAVSAFEKKLIIEALKKYGSFRNAAKKLGIHHSTLSRKAEKLNIIYSD
jgi:PAS domain S-box-containing protein